MNKLPEFKLETHLAQWEFKARHHMTASDPESMSLNDLLAMASAEDRQDFENMWLGYTETYGAPELLEEIARLYTQREPGDILCFAGASEGIFAANSVILEKDNHAIMITPNYQSHESLPASICATTAVPLNAKDNWSLDLDRFAAAVNNKTRLVSINFPHNPTGKILSAETFNGLVEICRRHGLYLLSDEVFRGMGPSGTEFSPQVADIYERGLSLNVMSKSYGLPGLRIGWIACADREVLARMEQLKHYLSICNSGPSEKLARIALRNRDKISARVNGLIDTNLIALNNFFENHRDRFEWRQPDAGCIGFPRYLGTEGVEQFVRRLLQEQGVLLLPASVYQSEFSETPVEHFRIGFGRRGMEAGLSAMGEYLAANLDCD